MAIWSSSDIGVDGLGVFLYLISNLVERFKGSFAMDGSEVRLLEKGDLVINFSHHGG